MKKLFFLLPFLALLTLGFSTSTFDHVAGDGSLLTALNATQLTAGTVPAAQMPALTGAITTSAGSVSTSLGSFSSASLATAITDETGSGLAVFQTSPTIVTPTIASFANANHSHQNGAGGGTLDGAAIGSGTVVAARLGITINNSYAALTDGATITWTCDSTKNIQNGTVTLAGNRTLAFASTSAGMTGVLIVKQDTTGSRTLALPATSKVINGGSGAITLSTAANAVDILTWVYDGSNYYWNYGKNYN